MIWKNVHELRRLPIGAAQRPLAIFGARPAPASHSSTVDCGHVAKLLVKNPIPFWPTAKIEQLCTPTGNATPTYRGPYLLEMQFPCADILLRHSAPCLNMRHRLKTPKGHWKTCKGIHVILRLPCSWRNGQRMKITTKWRWITHEARSTRQKLVNYTTESNKINILRLA